MLSKLLFALLLATATLYSADARLNDYPQTKEWLEEADTEGYAAFNIGVIYHKNIKDYDKAIEWYKKAYSMGDIEGANGLAYLCENILHDDTCAEAWYLKAAKGNERKALGNLAKLYIKKDDIVKAGAYAIALIDNGLSKAKIMDYLAKWKLSKKQIRQAYEIQKTLDIPKHYTGGIE